MRDNVNVSHGDFDKLALKMLAGDTHNVHMTGQYSYDTFNEGILGLYTLENNTIYK